MAETVDITQPVLIAVSKLGMFWRQNTGTFLTLDGRRHVRATSIEGVADIMGVYCGRAVAIETKTLRGKQRQSQVVFQAAWERNNGLYIIAMSPDDAVSQMMAGVR